MADDLRTNLGFDPFIERTIGSDVQTGDTSGGSAPNQPAFDLYSISQSNPLTGAGDNIQTLQGNIGQGALNFANLNISEFNVNQAIMGGATGYNQGSGWWFGNDGQNYKFFIGNSAGNKVTWDGTTLSVTGIVTIGTGGSVGGWTITATTIQSTGVTLSSSGNASIAFGTTPPTGPATGTGIYIDKTGLFGLAANSQVFKLDATTGNITCTGTIQATGGYIGTTTALVYESTGINCGTTGHIRGGQTDFNTGTGWFAGYSGGQYKFSFGNPSANYITWDGTNLTVNGYVQSGKGAFGGDGSDGALAISSGTTTIDCANAAILVKQYSSISITGTAKLTFINPNTNGTIIYLKCKGNVTITSSDSGAIDVSGMGGAGGASVAGAAFTPGNVGKAGLTNIISFGGGLGATSAPAPGAGGSITLSIHTSPAIELTKYVNVIIGGGGGSGGSANAGRTSGAGGNGGGGLVIECNGAFNFTTGGISSLGLAGGNSSGGAGFQVGGGGGGGGGGIIILYTTLTANSGSFNITGGAGGTGVFGGAGIGGGGGASALAGGAAPGGSASGGVGADGFSFVSQNTVFA